MDMSESRRDLKILGQINIITNDSLDLFLQDKVYVDDDATWSWTVDIGRI